ncbi:MAG TPA: M24 family metallopeptidase [Treponemataceae bacterium]|jgi:Xaa-Pro aminopeptidase|nr:M24 family metallopeptidase [Treponemataceae bacterium]
MCSVESFRNAIRAESLDGWLFCNFKHRDLLTDTLLGLGEHTVSSRLWVYIIPASGDPVKIVHSIESSILDSLPGLVRTYTGRKSLETLLSGFSGLRMGVLSDPHIQVLSTLDASSWHLFNSLGIRLCSASGLIQRTKGVLDDTLYNTHTLAAAVLHRAVMESWNQVRASFADSTPVYEGDLQDLMLSIFRQEGLVTDHPPIVAFGAASGNPHYTVPESGAPGNAGKRGNRLLADQVVQFDLWAKYPEGAYADISWIGYTGVQIPESVRTRFRTVITARDLVAPAISEAFSAGKTLTGYECDQIVRSFLLAHIDADAIRHRTGHGIDTDCHGSGVNLDSVEFPDHRLLIEGSCFSVEPGIYFPDYGLRTEINICIRNGTPCISSPEIQMELLTLET